MLADLLVAGLVLGCLAWLLLGVAGWRTLRALPRLADQPITEASRALRLSVISPARDEAATLAAAARVRLSDKDPLLQWVLVDDRSGDGTGALIDWLAEQDPRVRPVHVRKLPAGWLGKTWAMEQGVRAADGEWLLFSDADVHLQPGALRRALSLCEARELDHLAVLPELWPASLLTDATVSAFGRLFIAGTKPWAVSDPRSKAYVGVGAFNLVRRSALQAMGGLTRLRLDVADDLALGRLLKRSGARSGVAFGRGQVGLRWYATVGELARGLEKGLYAHAGRCRPWPLLGLGLVLLLFELAPWGAALLPHGVRWLHALGAITLVSSLIGAALGERSGGRRMAPALVMTPGGLVMALVVWRAALVGWRRGGVMWRGTLYPSGMLREAMGLGDEGWRGGVPPG